MNISITNLTQETQNLVPDTQLYVRTDQGDYSTLHASMFVTNPLPATALKPGYTESGQVSFNVSKQASRPLVYIDTGWNNYAPIVYDVLH